MVFKTLNDDIFNLSADAIVIPVGKKRWDNKGNEIALGEHSLEKQLYEKVEYEKLMAARVAATKKNDGVIDYGSAIITEAFGLENYEYIIMVATPVNTKRNSNTLIATPASPEISKLRSCCGEILECMKEKSINSVCLPLLGTGINCIPRDLAYSTIKSYFEHPGCQSNKQVTLCVKEGLDREDGVDLSKRIYMYIAENGDSHETIDTYLNYYLSDFTEEDFYEIDRNIQIYENFSRYKILEKESKQRVVTFLDSTDNERDKKQKLKEPFDILREYIEENGIHQSYLCDIMDKAKNRISDTLYGKNIPKNARNTYLAIAFFVCAPQDILEKIAGACENSVFPSTRRDGLILWHIRNQTNKDLMKAYEVGNEYYELEKLNADFEKYCGAPFYPINDPIKDNSKVKQKIKENYK